MGLSILSEIAIQADHRVLTAKDSFAPIDKTELALVASPDTSPATLPLAEFRNTVQAKAAVFVQVVHNDPFVIQISNSEGIHVRILAARCARGLAVGFTLPRKEGRRESRAPIAPAIVHTKAHEWTTGEPDHPAFPARWFTAYTCSPW